MRTALTRLEELNLQSLGDVADSPLDALEIVLGGYAGQLCRWANGIDPSPVVAPVVRPSLDETITLSPDEIDDGVLLSHLLDSLERLCRTLRVQRRMCGGASLTIRYSDQRDISLRERVCPSTCWEIDLTESVRTLFARVFRRRMRLRLMTLSLTDLSPFAQQEALFEERPPDEQHRRDRAQRLAVALDTLHQRFGERAIRYGRTH
jgi:DNA polymerase-4